MYAHPRRPSPHVQAPAPSLCIYLSIYPSIGLTRSMYDVCPSQMSLPPFGLHKILIRFQAVVHESTIRVLPIVIYNAHTIAMLLHDYCAIYAPLPTSLVYAIHHTILVVAISCKGQPPMCRRRRRLFHADRQGRRARLHRHPVVAHPRLHHLCVYLSIYRSIYLPIYLSIHLSVYLSVCLSVCLHLTIDLSNYRSIDRSIDPSFYRSIYLLD